MRQSEQNRSIPSFIKERQNSILKTRGDSSFFGITKDNDGMAVALKFITKIGEQKAIHYHDIVSPMEYDGSSEIAISTNRITIVISGRNLDNLFDHIIQHQVKWIKELDSSYLPAKEDELEIEVIRFEVLQ